ncbi:MAG: tRNA threonylcarbamoyladenosine dehydratase [Fibrobacter sp.]|nr:tRNA threonylcarbamoyladenosine dehydratase [Fibrobacter sp.]
MMFEQSLNRLELLTGKDALQQLNATKVIIFGVGGVGSWCAEALIRNGIGNLTIVDSDRICVTNINRQLQATSETVGKIKVDVLKKRLQSINPDASITALSKVYNKNSAQSFTIEQYHYCVDAIDSLSNKVELLVHAFTAGCKVYTALGAACKLDVSRIKTGSLWKSEGCHLGRFVRKRLRKRKFNGDIQCVYSDEMLPNTGEHLDGCGTDMCICPVSADPDNPDTDWCSLKKQINGSAVHITASFGFFLAGMITKDIVDQVTKTKEQP